MLKTAVSFALLAASVAGCAYLAVAVGRTIAFARKRATPENTPERAAFVPVTVLKPLCGDEPGLYENLASFCDQDHTSFQVLFGVRDARDAAVDVARRVIADFPNVDATLVIDDRVSVANRKISNVLNMMKEAKHPVLVVADSDVRVDRSYLRDVSAPFRDPQVGAVTCLYRAVPRNHLSNPRERNIADLAAMFVEEHFAPSVLVATALGPMDFCLGATMAVSRAALEDIGGFAAVGSYLADDQMLGRLVTERGLQVVLSSHVVATDVAEPDLAALWRHELRWAVTMHAARPLGYSFSFLTYGLVLALGYALVSPSPMTALTLVLIAAGLRLALHYAARRALGSQTADGPWLILPRDILGFAIFTAHFFSNTIRWRDASYRLDRRGQLEALTDLPQQRPAR